MRALHLLGSTGNDRLDNAIVARLTHDAVAVPPQYLPQPITIVLQAGAPDGGCSRGAVRE